MMILGSLPTELILSIFHYLPLQSLHALRRTSHHWDDLFRKHENVIYHNAAIYHGFAASINVTLDEAKSTHRSRSLQEVGTWRAFCKWCFLLERNWAGQGSVTTQVLSEDRNDVHRVKVDERLGILITTHQDGGLVVRDLETDEVLWGLPRTYVRSHAHCEYDNGFLIFDRFGQAKEVWRIASEYETPPRPLEPPQEDVSRSVADIITSPKGNFKPWALLTSPEPGRAFRFVYPTLLVAGFQKAYLYDVRTAELKRTIEDMQVVAGGEGLGEINYVEVSKQHVYVCGTSQLRIFDRESGSLAYYISSLKPPRIGRHFIVHPPPEDMRVSGVSVVPLIKEDARKVEISPDSEFVAVHVSPDAQTFVALLSDGRVLVVKDVSLLIRREKTFAHHTTEISFSCCEVHFPWVKPISIYLAYECGRAGIITTGGIYILNLDPTRHGFVDPELQKSSASGSSSPSPNPFQYFIPVHVLPFRGRSALRQVSCLQMTETKMLWTWDCREPDLDLEVPSGDPTALPVPGVDFTVLLDGQPVQFEDHMDGPQEAGEDEEEQAGVAGGSNGSAVTGPLVLSDDEWPPLGAQPTAGPSTNTDHTNTTNHTASYASVANQGINANHANDANHNIVVLGNNDDDGMMNLQQWLAEERATRKSVVSLDFTPAL